MTKAYEKATEGLHEAPAIAKGERLTAARTALGFGGDDDAYDNLLGAMIDLRDRHGLEDQVVLRTIERVLSQLGEARQILRGEPDKAA